MEDIKSLRNNLEQKKGQKIKVEQDILTLRKEIAAKKQDLQKHEKAREIIRIVGKSTQEQLSFHISDITSLALEAIFNDPYKLQIEFVPRRNKTECDLYFVRNENKVDPLKASGVGAVDVAAFALRIAAWSMQTPHSRNVMLLDEPFKHLKGVKANLRLLDMINEISNRLKLQTIMVSDERVDKEDIYEKADRVFEVTIKKGISKIT
jgi:hypothetical protein